MSKSSSFLPLPVGFATTAIHSGSKPEQWESWQVVPPISLSTTYKQPVPAEPVSFDYTRSGNPTREVLEKCIAALDDCDYGLCYASGLSATMTIIHLLQAGDHILSCDDVYGGTNRYFTKCAQQLGISTTFVDATNLKQVEESVKPNTKLVWLESPTNPLLKVIDIQKLSELVKAINPSILLVVDNTFLTSYLQKPLALGADIAVYSCTKYLNGHSDVLMGALTTKSAVLYERLRFLQKSLGAVPSAFDCYLVNRSLKTLAIRMRQHITSGLAVARYLEKHPKVVKVMHPGLPSHPQHEIALKQTSGNSGMLSFVLAGGSAEAILFLQSLKIFTLAESLGGYESLAEQPSTMTHASVPEDQRAQLGISDSLVRLSVGLEDEEDLIEDLRQALAKTFP